MKAEIITIGDELLIGQVVDTNSAFLGRELNLNGIRVHKITSIADDRIEILDALENAQKNCDVIIVTGGLGPTKDDVTKQTLCEFFQTHLVLNKDVEAHVKSFFTKRNRPFTELNRKQAEVPENCTVLHNENGTAPGMWFEKTGKVFISLPGVPYEMKTIFSDYVLPKIKSIFKTPFVYHCTVRTQGIGESFLAEKISDWEDSLKSLDFKLAYLPSPGAVRLRISSYNGDSVKTPLAVENKINELLPLLGDHFAGLEKYGEENNPLEKILGDMLMHRKMKIALAESCTGGYLAHLITSIPGSSRYFNGAIIPYHNEFKNSFLQVDENVFLKAGAVSEECVLQMATAVQKKFKADCSIAISGIAGPDGGTADKPVGTVWIAVSIKDKVMARKFLFGSNRERNILMSAQSALLWMKNELEKKS